MIQPFTTLYVYTLLFTRIVQYMGLALLSYFRVLTPYFERVVNGNTRSLRFRTKCTPT